jgi:DNA replication initiation complex subunit (GINS family)
MDAEALRDLQRREKMSPYLQELDKDFYRELRKYLGGILRDIKSERVDTSKLALKLVEYENLRNIVNDLYETRERKIVSSALYYVKSGDKLDTKNLTSEEEEVLRGIVGLLREKRRKVLEKVLGQGEIGGEEAAEEMSGEVEEHDHGEEAAEGLEGREEYVTVRILKDLPSIVGVDGKVYGAFKKEDVVTLPRANAETLVNRGAAEKIDLGKLYI